MKANRTNKIQEVLTKFEKDIVEDFLTRISRTQIVMESLLQSIVETGSEIAIIDITSVPAVDTLVAQHHLKTVSAARLMGAQCIISGIRPQIAQTMVHLGVAFGDVVTKASMADAISYAFKQMGFSVTRKQA